MKLHRSLLGGGGNPLENRKLLNFWARFAISIANAFTFLVLLYLLFYSEVQESSRDLVNILCGAYVAVLAKSTDYWFREKKDHEHEEEMDRVNRGTRKQINKKKTLNSNF